MHEQEIESMRKENKRLSEQILLMQVQINKFSARGEVADKPPPIKGEAKGKHHRKETIR